MLEAGVKNDMIKQNTNGFERKGFNVALKGLTWYIEIHLRV